MFLLEQIFWHFLMFVHTCLPLQRGSLLPDLISWNPERVFASLNVITSIPSCSLACMCACSWYCMCGLKKASGIRLTSSPQRWKIHKAHTHTHTYLQTDKKRCRRQTCSCVFVYVTLRGHVYPPSASRCCTNALYHSTKARPQAFM